MKTVHLKAHSSSCPTDCTHATVLNADGSVAHEVMGKDFDIVIDAETGHITNWDEVKPLMQKLP